jgi:hypothetical protein
MKRRRYVAATSAIAAAVAGCLESEDEDGGDNETDSADDGGTDGDTDSGPSNTVESVVQEFYTAIDEDPDPARIDELFHSRSPTSSYWSQVFENTNTGDGADIVDTTTRVSVENPTESELDSEIGTAIDDQTFDTVLSIVEESEQSAIVEIDVDLEQNGNETQETDIWVVAVEDGEWQLVW